MFGAIPVTGVESGRAEEVTRFGMFGMLHPEWAPAPLLEKLRGLGKRLEIAHIGRIGGGEAIWRAMEQRHGREIAFKRYGEQPAERVSQFLTDMDFGIATTPLALIGKSATAAAMLEHGLPVIVNRDDVRYAGIATERPAGVIAMDGAFIESLRAARKSEPRRRLEGVADQFLRWPRRRR
jgi:glycosyltransferase involved in cell wall biosynthesis